MKILHIINYYHEGLGYQENFLPVNQSKMGHKVKIVTSDFYAQFPNYDSTMKVLLGDRKKGSGLYKDNGITVIRKSSMFSNSRPGFIYFSVADVLTEFLPDIVHVHGVTNFWLMQVVYYQSKYKFKIFIDSHQDYSVENYSASIPGRLYYYLWSLCHRWLIKKHIVSQYLPITQQASEWLIERLSIPTDIQKISPLGVDLATMFHNPKDEEKLREKWGAENKLIIVNAGKQYKEKGICWIIDIVALLSKRDIDVFLVLVGSADELYNKKIDHKLTQLEKDAWIRMPFQRRDELRKVYSAADIGVWPGIPSNTIQEAMACKVAMLLPNNNIVGHLIDGNGFFISELDELTVNSMYKIACSKTRLSQMKLKSFDIATKYSWKNISSDLVEIYKSSK